MIKEHPILFSAPMICAILEGRKTQTRRIVKPQPSQDQKYTGFVIESTDKKKEGKVRFHSGGVGINHKPLYVKCPYGKIGDRLWVRENWRTDKSLDNKKPKDFCGWPVKYDADDSLLTHGSLHGKTDGKTRVSIHMPRWASRINLEITEIRVERLQDISEKDALAEGIEIQGSRKNFMTGGSCRSPQASYSTLWESINGKGSWDKNPWVWVVCFKRIKL